MAKPTTQPAAKMVYCFGDGTAEGTADMCHLLGTKGANLAEMSRIGLPVPPGFTITKDACLLYYTNKDAFLATLEIEVYKALAQIGKNTGLIFSDPVKPLLVSVRAGARASMPGMMDTVLNLGLNDETVQGLAKQSANVRFAYDSYRRFIQAYSDVVLGIDNDIFEDLFDTHKRKAGVNADVDLTVKDMQDIVSLYKKVVKRECGQPFPQDVKKQLWETIFAVFESWHSVRAQTYRKYNDILDDWGTAVTVQAMVFGNMGQTSGTGVAFTRNPSTGAKEIYGEFLLNTQGEDLVTGIQTPQPLTQTASASGRSLEAHMPETYKELVSILQTLERHYRDMQDVEFTIQDGQLWILQTRGGKRTAKAAVKIAVELAQEGVLTQAEAAMSIEPHTLDQLLKPVIDPGATKHIITVGLPASPGAASGEIVFNSNDAEKRKSEGRSIILVRPDTSPDDIHGMHAADGILTVRGGMTSHAAVIARGIGRPCVSGAIALRIDEAAQIMTLQEQIFKSGDIITIDGSTGEVMKGAVKMCKPAIIGDLSMIMEWARKMRHPNQKNTDITHDTKDICALTCQPEYIIKSQLSPRL